MRIVFVVKLFVVILWCIILCPNVCPLQMSAIFGLLLTSLLIVYTYPVSVFYWLHYWVCMLILYRFFIDFTTDFVCWSFIGLLLTSLLILYADPVSVFYWLQYWFCMLILYRFTIDFNTNLVCWSCIDLLLTSLLILYISTMDFVWPSVHHVFSVLKLTFNL